MNITIEFFTRDPNKNNETFLGFTKIDLEKRYFNENYHKKLEYY